ncbi:hypothetical protein SAMN04487897_10193 [Paenibacillus sp. yr247]|uniref:hypothetical protein n=1 Tax=Paenibacillus sp. yr247 TaxID=1761880 RepID=UPI000886CACC|nr:hypothetical protein [Paenibacillus sp. yr247]SDM80271.1 hypothetical protein SAMN04487897_10193 [Paenibacillus sp. yr247]
MKKTKYKSTKRRSRNREIAQVTAQIKDVINKVPVLIVLRDGSCYCGIVRDLQGQELLFEGVKGKKTLPKNSTKADVNISGIGGLAGLLGNLGGLGGLFGGLGGKGGGGFLGSLGGFMKIGMGMLKFIVPLMSGFGI